MLNPSLSVCFLTSGKEQKKEMIAKWLLNIRGAWFYSESRMRFWDGSVRGQTETE